jgi:hypothetical protein
MGLLGRNGVVLIATVAVGSVKNISVGVSVDKLKEYVMGSDKPDTLLSGNKTFTVSIEKLYVNSTHAAQVIAGTPVVVEVRPEGTGGGKPKITLTDVILDKCDFKAANNGIIGENITGEGKDIAWGTQ